MTNAEILWDCPTCGSAQILDASCPQCGSPRSSAQPVTSPPDTTVQPRKRTFVVYPELDFEHQAA
ncbi:MAG: hypothetical protein ACYDBJ_28070 [Aggregatilineales bacterium]